MNRAAQCIKMLMILRTESQLSTKQLAERLDTNPRNIREYRRELEEAGYTIHEKRGRYGGYYLDRSDVLLLPKLTREEEDHILTGLDYVKSQSFLGRDDFISGIQKLLMAASTQWQSTDQATTFLTDPAAGLSEDQKVMLEMAAKAIHEHRALVLSYQGREKPEPVSVLIDPYKIVYIGGYYYLIAWSHTARDYRNYRFSTFRMLEMQETNRSFEPDENFHFENYIGSSSAFKDKVFVFEVRVQKSSVRLFEEMYWGEDLHKTDDNQEWTDYTFVSDNRFSVYNQLFSMGDVVLLKAPENVRKEFEQKVQTVCRLYEENR